MTQIIVERKNVLFQFIEDAIGNRFVNKASSGIIISSLDINQSGVARWGKVTHLGELVEEVSVGDYILLEPGKWTAGFYIDGERYWKTDIDQVLLTADEPSGTY